MKTLIKQREHTSRLFLLCFLCFITCQLSFAQGIPFEVEEHFEIHDDPDIGIKLMPEEYCENSTSEDYGFVFKRKRKRILSDPPAPANGDCEDIFADPYLEFYPQNFADSSFVISSLGTAENRWSTLYVGGIQATGGISTGYGGQYTNQIILPSGRNLLQEGDGLADDGVIFSPTDGLSNSSDITLWAKDDIVMNFRYSDGQPDGQFKITENGVATVHFKIESGGDIFMPSMDATTSFYPYVVLNPLDGKLYYQEFPSSKLTDQQATELSEDIQSVKQENETLKKEVELLKDLLNAQISDLTSLKESLKVNSESH